ncbi:hypothetical protein ACFCT7_08520 [Fulvivirgaceae bacterium LMO-SS25]
MNTKPDQPTFINPFLSEEREQLWEKIDKNAKPISKEELLGKIKNLKEKAGK